MFSSLWTDQTGIIFLVGDMQTPRQTVSLSKLCATLDSSGSLRMDGTFDWLSPNLPPPSNRHREPVSRPLAMRAHDRGSAVRPDDVVSTASARDEAQGQILLRVDSITKQYADLVVLADVGFDIHAGEIIGIIGPNGAGKTTLLEALAGILPIDKGDVCWRGKPLPTSRRREAIFYLPDGVRPYQDQPDTRVLP